MFGGDSSNTTPQPSGAFPRQLVFDPPYRVVPYRLPAASETRFPTGDEPSAPPVKLWSVCILGPAAYAHVVNNKAQTIAENVRVVCCFIIALFPWRH